MQLLSPWLLIASPRVRTASVDGVPSKGTPPETAAVSAGGTPATSHLS
jgi:hypothetical protein